MLTCPQLIDLVFCSINLSNLLYAGTLVSLINEHARKLFFGQFSSLLALIRDYINSINEQGEPFYLVPARLLETPE